MGYKEEKILSLSTNDQQPTTYDYSSIVHRQFPDSLQASGIWNLVSNSCVNLQFNETKLQIIGQNAKLWEKMKNPASFDVKISRPKKAKSRLLPQKTGYAAEIRSIYKRNVAAIVKLEEKRGLIHPIVNRFKDSTKPLNIQYGPPSTDTQESA